MKKLGLFTIAAAMIGVSGLSLGSAANATSLTFAPAPGGFDSTGTFSYTDPVTFTGYGSGPLTVSGDYTTEFDAGGTVLTSLSDVSASFTGSDPFSFTGGSGSLYLGGGDFLLGASSGSQKFTLTSFIGSEVSSSAYTIGTTTGLYSSTPAPEASSLIGFGAVLLAGGMMTIVAKRKANSNVA